METYHPPKEVEDKEDNSNLPEREVLSEKWLLEKIDSLIPLIKEKWPNIAQQTLEATKGSIDDLVEVIASNTGTSAIRIKSQLFFLKFDLLLASSINQLIYSLGPF